MNTILITGGAGFIGSSFADMVCKQGYYAVILDKLTYAGRRENLSHLPHGSHELVVGDICDQPLIDALLEKHKPAMVFNFAAESHVDNSIAGPKEFLRTNIDGTYAMLEATRHYHAKHHMQGFRFVQVSTDEVYGALGKEGVFTENSPTRPNSPYSASKAAADGLARAWYTTYGLPTIITRCSNNYGVRQFPEKLIPRMITNALAGKPLPVYGTGENVRDWIHVDDHCAGVYLAARRGHVGEVYNFGGHTEISNIALVKQICSILDTIKPRTDGQSYATQISFVEDRLGHDFRYAIDDAKARNALGFVTKIAFNEGLKAVVEWYVAQ